MKITVLGFSGGVQAADTGNSSLLVQGAEANILVDVSGSPCSDLLNAGLDPDELDAVFLTHAHVDHIYAFPSLVHNLWLRKRRNPLIVFGNTAVAAKAQGLISFFLLDKKSDMVPLRWETTLSRVGDVEVSIFPLFHRPLVPTSGFSFRDASGLVSYFPDSVSSAPFPDCAMGSDLVIHEAQGLAADEANLKKQGHSSARMAAEAARALHAGRLLLLHLPELCQVRNAMLAEAKSIFPASRLPVRGLEIRI